MTYYRHVLQTCSKYKPALKGDRFIFLKVILRYNFHAIIHPF